MNRYTYDLHVHSCLSPCADNDNTPNNLAGMAALNGISIMALTDHNSCRNCPAFFAAAKRYGIIPVPGMELTTAEDIHVVCLFEELEDALRFNDEIDRRRIMIPNRKDIFGDQLILDETDEVIGEEAYLLSNATTVTLEEVPELVKTYRGVSYPAHIDREANGIIAVLGTFPEKPFFTAAELHFSKNLETYPKEFPILNGKTLVVSSDTHYLGDLREENESFLIEDEPYSGALVRKNLLRMLKGEA